MYALIECQGKQFRVEEGRKLFVPFMGSVTGDVFSCDKVLLYSDGLGGVRVGMPFLDSVKVEGKVSRGEFKDEKVIVYKYKRRKDYHKKRGHRQKYTEVLIEKISVS